MTKCTMCRPLVTFWPLITTKTSENLAGNISDALKTAICSFLCITHISDKIFRCC